MSEWLLRISNEYRNLSEIEIRTLLGSKNLIKLNEVLFLFVGNKNQLNGIFKKSASVKWILYEPITIPIDEIFNNVKINNLDFEVHSFAVETETIFEKENEISTSRLKMRYGDLIKNKYKHMKVDLKNPQIKYMIILVGRKSYLGWVYYEMNNRMKQLTMAPKNLPFGGGGAMKPYFVKLLVNLLENDNDIILDPFSGHGGILREIENSGYQCVGFEISYKIIRESLINNKYNNKNNISLIVCDALKAPLRKNAIKQVVTDPPYFIQTSTKADIKEKIVDKWLNDQKYKKVIFAFPKRTRVDIPKNYKIVEEVDEYIHRSLTRVIRILSEQI